MSHHSPYKIYDPWGRVYPLDSVLNGVGPGWSKLVQRLIRDLFALGWDGQLHQIKEKFGGLRFYIGTGAEEIHERIYRAENDSFSVCEDCGEPGSTEGSGYWIRTLCQECRTKEKKGVL